MEGRCVTKDQIPLMHFDPQVAQRGKELGCVINLSGIQFSYDGHVDMDWVSYVGFATQSRCKDIDIAKP